MLVRCQPCQRIFASMDAMRAHQKVGQCLLYWIKDNRHTIINNFVSHFKSLFTYFRARNVSTIFLQENLPETLRNKMLMDQRN